MSSSSLQVILTDTNSVQFCINRNVTFVCTVQASTFLWTVGSLLTGTDLSPGTNGALNTETRGMFTLTAEGASAPNFRSTLQVIVSPEFNGSLVRCANNIDTNINEEVTLITHGKFLYSYLLFFFTKS